MQIGDAVRCKYDHSRKGIVERVGWNEQLNEVRWSVRWDVKATWSHTEFGRTKRFDLKGRPVLEWRFDDQVVIESAK